MGLLIGETFKVAMAEKKCPYCSSQSFCVKATRDRHEVYEFNLKGGEIVPSSENIEPDRSRVGGATETY